MVMFDPPRGDACFSADGKHRLRLRRWWIDRPERWVAWLMLNPSDAGKNPSDPTMDIVNRFSKGWGFDGCIVVNLYPAIAPKQDDLWEWRRSQMIQHGPSWTTRNEEMRDNLIQIEEAGRSSIRRVAAFGSFVRDRYWVKECIRRFEQPTGSDIKESLRCLRVTSTDLPAHPKPWGNTPIPSTAREKPEPWDKRPRWLTP